MRGHKAFAFDLEMVNGGVRGLGRMRDIGGDPPNGVGGGWREAGRSGTGGGAPHGLKLKHP